jgi:cytochrome oxidase Cu insertion factor (SCO1/SenC/PrrC family)
MRNITERCWRIPTRSWAQSLVVMVFVLGIGGNVVLAAGPAVGPKDGDGLAPTDLERVKVGDAAPDFTLEAENGTPITLSQFRGNKYVILVFYRGHW